jgi:fumarate reductase flavoprotein subunit
MGGIRTDHRGESSGLNGLFSVGEAACWDMHGFNRLGGNSVAETVVAGMLVGEFIADHCDSRANQPAMSTALVADALAEAERRLEDIAAGAGDEDAFALTIEMQKVMTDKVGIFRDGPDLEAAVDVLEDICRRSYRIRLKSQARGANPELDAAYRAQMMSKLALCVAKGALERTESRGAHYRRDYPQRNDRDWLSRTLARWSGGDDGGPALRYEALDVNRMELPPGWRGYGAQDHIEHPDVAAREADIEQLSAGASDRHELQARLMPYEELLPERYRGRNERLDRGYS